MKKEFVPFGPFIFSRMTHTTKHIILCGLLSVNIIILIIQSEYTAIINIVSAVFAVLISNLIETIINKDSQYFDFSLITTGMIIGLCFPTNFNFIFIFFLTFLSFFIAKIFFGGQGSNWVSPIIITICIAYVSANTLFPANINNIELITSNGNIFSTLQISELKNISQDQAITSTLNSFFHRLGVVVPDGYVSLIVNNTSTIPAFRYNFIFILSSVILISFNVIDYIIPLVFLSTYGILVWIFGMLPINGTLGTGDILVAWCTSGTLFYAFFILPENSTTPNTFIGKIIFAILTGIFAFLICGPGGSSAGMPFSILFASVFSPIIETLENNFLKRKIRKMYE